MKAILLNSIDADQLFQKLRPFVADLNGLLYRQFGLEDSALKSSKDFIK